MHPVQAWRARLLLVLGRAEVDLPRWEDRLGGVQAFTQDHWAAMLMAPAHDWGVEGTR
jgi:hypothetical protein